MNLHEYLSELKNDDLLVEIEKEVNLDLEISSYLTKYPDKAVMFHKPGKSEIRLVGNLLTTRRQLYSICGIKENLHEGFKKLVENSKEPKMVEDNPTFCCEKKVNLLSLPIPKFFPSDGGRYLTSGIVFAKFPENGKSNGSIHRIMITGKDSGVIRLVPRDLYQIFKENQKMGNDTPVAIAVGYHPALALAASMPLPYGETELATANAIMNNKLTVTKSPEYEILVPTDVEFILEGKIVADEEQEEGPFVDITGTIDQVRKQPVIKIERMYHKENPIFQTVLPAAAEHYILMGFPREIAIYNAVSYVVPKVKDVRLTNGGNGWLHAVISIKDYKYGDPKNVAFAAFAAHPSLKWCTIVDEDIDVNNPTEVEWAVITRTRKKDIVVIDETRGSSLDPAKNPVTQTSIKVIIDATIKGKGEEKGFKRVIKNGSANNNRRI